jgi:Gpi18-like mannosyltransferase
VTATASTTAAPTEDGWRRVDWAILGSALVIGLVIRVLLLPTEGLRGDMDQFVAWVHHIASRGLGTLYGETDVGAVAFGPVMAYIWAALTVIEPDLATAVDASDPSIRVLMKLPATIADLGLAAVVLFALRGRPRWAAIAAAVVLLHPVVFYVSAWWGQYESIFMLSALGAIVAAIGGRNGLAAALLAVSISTKPQAIPFVVPFAAWFWAIGSQRDGVRGGLVEVGRALAIGAGVSVLLWLPFFAVGGPLGYLEGLRGYQDEVFNALSLNAWNAWWLLQEATPGRGFVADDIALLGPITLRHLGYLVTALLSIAVGAAIVREPRPRTLILGCAASVLVFYTFMTQMHERYAYGAIVILVLLVSERMPRLLWLALGTVVALNLLSAAPATPAIGSLLPTFGLLGIVGSLVIVAGTTAALRLVRAPAARTS